MSSYIQLRAEASKADALPLRKAGVLLEMQAHIAHGSLEDHKG